MGRKESNQTKSFKLIGLAYPYQLDQSISVLRVVYQNFDRIFYKRSAASDLDLHCLPMSHKKDVRLISSPEPLAPLAHGELIIECPSSVNCFKRHLLLNYSSTTTSK